MMRRPPSDTLRPVRQLKFRAITCMSRSRVQTSLLKLSVTKEAANFLKPLRHIDHQTAIGLERELNHLRQVACAARPPFATVERGRRRMKRTPDSPDNCGERNCIASSPGGSTPQRASATARSVPRSPQARPADLQAHPELPTQRERSKCCRERVGCACRRHVHERGVGADEHGAQHDPDEHGRGEIQVAS